MRSNSPANAEGPRRAIPALPAARRGEPRACRSPIVRLPKQGLRCRMPGASGAGVILRAEHIKKRLLTALQPGWGWRKCLFLFLSLGSREPVAFVLEVMLLEMANIDIHGGSFHFHVFLVTSYCYVILLLCSLVFQHYCSFSLFFF